MDGRQAMKAMILAAGEGRRMQPLTLGTPKPLLKAGDKCLIEHHLSGLASAGIVDVVINVAYLGGKIIAALGDGERYGLNICYSIENAPLETAGGILHALPLLGEQPFLLVNGDIWTDYDFSRLLRLPMAKDRDAHLVLVDNPAHNPAGDYGLDRLNWVTEKSATTSTYTFSGISVINPRLISRYPNKRNKFPLKEVFDEAIARCAVSGEYFGGEWDDIGTPERLAMLDQRLPYRLE